MKPVESYSERLGWHGLCLSICVTKQIESMKRQCSGKDAENRPSQGQFLLSDVGRWNRPKQDLRPIHRDRARRDDVTSRQTSAGIAVSQNEYPSLPALAASIMVGGNCFLIPEFDPCARTCDRTCGSRPASCRNAFQRMHRIWLASQSPNQKRFW